MFVLSYIPFLLILIGNVIIILLLHINFQRHRRLTQNGADSSGLDDLIILSILLVSKGMVYLFLTLPYIIYLLIEDILPNYMRHHYDTYDEYASGNQLLISCSLLFVYINNSINFLIYCICSPPFRSVFVTRTKSCALSCRRAPNQVAPTTNGQITS